MKNIPRIFVNDNMAPGAIVQVGRDVSHYLTHVMRNRDCIAFGGGDEFTARLSDDGRALEILESTGRADPAGNVVLYCALIKRMDDLVNMVTQMGVKEIRPVITERTVAPHINIERMEKIAIAAAQQSNRNSVPKIFPPVRFDTLDLSNMIFADESAAHGVTLPASATGTCVLTGPEGGFSDTELAALRGAGARGISLGKTVLRAELAAAIAISRIEQ